MEVSKSNGLSPMADLFCTGAPQTSEASICTLINYKQWVRRKIDNIRERYTWQTAWVETDSLKAGLKSWTSTALGELCTETNNRPALTDLEKNRSTMMDLLPMTLSHQGKTWSHSGCSAYKEQGCNCLERYLSKEVYYYFSVWYSGVNFQ